MTESSQRTLWQFGFFNLVLIILYGIWFLNENTPIPIVDVSLPNSGKFECISYAPYYGPGQTPFKLGTIISRTQIDNDLRFLSKYSSCVRSYSVGQGMDYVPEAASKLGLKVYLGAWVGWKNSENEAEINLAIDRANKYPDTVKALIIGNEVLLRGEQTEATMQYYFQLARNKTKIPITYADVWEYWIKHKNMEKSVDFVTVHILPYWENNPQPIEHAVDHASNVMNLLKTIFIKPILIGETGWPSVGRQRDASKPSLINQATYIREFLSAAQSKGWNYNLIEAFDQPWKRELEGTVGGYWGIFSSSLTPKFSLTGTVAERSDLFNTVIYGLAGLVIILGISLKLGERRPSALFLFATIGSLAGVNSMLQLDYLYSSSSNPEDFFFLGSVMIAGWAATLSLIWIICGKNHDFHSKVINYARFYLLITSISAGFLLLIDGRYRDFPIALYLLPGIVLSLSKYLDVLRVQFGRRLGSILCSLSVIFASLCFILEHKNVYTLLWIGITVLIAYSSWPNQLNNNSELNNKTS